MNLLIMEDADGSRSYYEIDDLDWWLWITNDHFNMNPSMHDTYKRAVVGPGDLDSTNRNQGNARAQVAAVALDSCYVSDRRPLGTYEDIHEGTWF